MALPISSFQNVVTMATTHFSSDLQKRQAFLLLGAPGGGKTACGIEVGMSMGFSYTGDETKDEIVIVRPSFHTPVDYSGVPTVKDGITAFAPPDFIHRLTTGQVKMVILDEVPDAMPSVQNILCSMIYDFTCGGLQIHPDTRFFLTGNRVEDRSGAGRLITKLQNRCLQHELGMSVDDFVSHGGKAGFNVNTLAYIHWRGEKALYGEDGFDPSEPTNSTPRQWEAVGNVSDELPKHLWLNMVKSLVPECWAEDYLGFCRTVADLPPISEVINNPKTAPVSDKIDVCYALISRLITEVQKVRDFQHLIAYVTRLKPEIQMLFVNAIRKRVPEIRTTPEYIKWCTKNQAYFGANA